MEHAAARSRDPSPARRWCRIGIRILTIVTVAVAVGWFTRYLAIDRGQNREPAGFSRGLLQGALMPIALPNLLVGRDVIIYAENNTGVTYKLGYTLGVNVCGTFFFGMLFWRLSRWRRGGAET